ncbi:hypothetical protein C2845_PM18G02660 [Panicum miliaceum]|uniref:Disease resistance protein RPM1-like n=1 Tax=Panicum miliaceum TaxID=4540 RepID=A0A3L6PIE5_PANMI|nr:hypothetical protein C2845_PM18G02660 [Panicum miliaceum]
MAEAFVGLLISKLGMALGKEAAKYGASQISKEASDLRGLVDEIHKAKEELESIKAYLHDTEKFKDTNETTSIFVGRIQDLAFQIEDVVDEFTYKLEDDKHIGFASKTKKRIRHINIWGRLALELRRINVELEDATKRRDRYTMLRIGKDNGSDHHARSNNQTVCLPRKEDLVGIEDSVDELKRWLVSDFDESNSKLFTVWGMGGVGKTTLVDHVYNIVKKDFDAAAWVTVSKNYQVEDLFKKIAREFGISVDANNMELRSLVADIRKYLEEDYHIKRRRLIRHWITAGFIKKQEKTALEQVAEGYLNELVSRSLLQVAKTNEFGRVKCCRMHDVIRCLALEKAERESFAKVYGGSGRFWIGTARRLSIQSTNIATLSESGAMHFRAIHAFTSYVDIDLLKPMLASSNLISTLDLQDTQIKMLPNEVFNLFNLRFLGLRNTGIEILPEAVGRLQNLEVLDAFGTALLSLPEGVAKLKKLRYLYASALLTEGTVTDFGGVKVPRGIRNLTGLHALQKVKASSETLCDVEALVELRTFSVCNVTSENSLNLCHAIMSMRHLVHLSISASNETERLPLQALNLPALSKLDENTFSKLVVLSGLCYLRLFKAYDGKKLCFSAQSFPVLRQLEICDTRHLNHIEIEEGALERLVELELAECPELKCLPEGIVYLRALEQLRLEDTAEELIEKVRQESEANGCNEEVAIMLSEKNRLEILP